MVQTSDMLRVAVLFAPILFVALAESIAYGIANPKLSGFSDLMGGPLDASQAASPAALLRTWGPNAPKASASPPPAGS
jgi:hypothetical protein